tara:strand:+ start:455 stop:1693 length:1239 start_codon:yes stop_codon:yes gene_type:complete
MENLGFYISKNGRYMMTESIVYDFAHDRHAHIDEISFSDLIDIIGENVEYMVQNLKSDLREMSSFTRKSAYNVFEYFESDKKLSLMMEYEVKFGTSLLNESVANPHKIIKETWDWVKEQTKILEQTYNPFNKEFYTASNWKKAGKNVVDDIKSTAKSVGNAILNPIDTVKKGINWVKKNGIGGVMEYIREFLYSGKGIAIQIFAQMTGIGNLVVGVVWGAMLLWDLYKVFSGKDWDWLHIVFDVMGIISGGLVGGLKAAMSGLNIAKGGGLQGMKTGLTQMAKSPSTKKYMSTIANKGSWILNQLKAAANWLYKWTGLKWISGIINKFEVFLSENILKPIGNGLGLKTVGNKVVGQSTAGQATRQSVAGAATTAGIRNPGIQAGFEQFNKIRGVKPTGLSDDVVDQLDDMLG